jgi:hypothetical protein
VVSPNSWLVSNIWFLLSTGHVAIGMSGSSLPVCARWSNLLVSSSCSCVALQLQQWLVSSSPRKVGQFSLACHPIHTLSLCASPHLHSLRVRLLALHPFFGVYLAFHPTPTVSGRIQFTVYVSQFKGGVQSAHRLCWIMFPQIGGGVVCTAWHSPVGFANLCR